MKQPLPLIWGIYQWMEMAPGQTKPLSSIEHVCRELSRQRSSEADPKNAIFSLFFPLTISGTVEIAPDGYRLSPSCILQNERNSVYINVPNRMHPPLGSSYDSLPGIKVYPRSCAGNSAAEAQGIPIQAFRLSDCLQQTPPLRTILESWEDDVAIDRQGYFYYDASYQWVPAPNPLQAGIYKKGNEVFAPRVYCLAPDKWKKMPSRNENPDAFSLSVVYGRIQQRWDIRIRYQANEGRLLLQQIFFPRLLERFLFINTLLASWHPNLIKERSYYLAPKDFQLLNHKLEHSILTNE
jgi:hypothetical protein